MKYKKYTGKVWYASGYQGSVVQPPYIIRFKNRWYRHSHYKCGKSCILDSFPYLDNGLNRVKNYLLKNYGKYKIHKIPRPMQISDIPEFLCEDNKE